MAGIESSNQQAKVWKDWRKETNDSSKRSLWRFSRYISNQNNDDLPFFFDSFFLPIFIEEFGIYLQYVRKLGFEETPDYDFLRELFDKVLERQNEQDDGVYDWMLLNEGKGWEVIYNTNNEI